MRIIIDTSKISQLTLKNLYRDYHVNCEEDLRGEYIDYIIVNCNGLNYGMLNELLQHEGYTGIEGCWPENANEILNMQLYHMIMEENIGKKEKEL